MNSDSDARSGVINLARWSAVRRPRRAPQAVSIGLLVLATVMGVHLGIGGPEVSPVSPAALAARYGTPPAGAPAPPPVEAAATLPAVVPAAPPVEIPVALPAEVAAAPAVETPTEAAIAPSPNAITAPSASAPAPPPADTAAVPSHGVAAAQPAFQDVMQRGHQRGQHEGGGHD